jgi:transcriptional regulator with XRE-family HTH domain/tetratricopeptide (TPR) repeat protein
MQTPNRLRQLRRNAGWTQADLIDALITTANRLGLPSPTPSSWKTLISMYENGRRPMGTDHRKLFRETYQVTDEELGLSTALAHPTEPVGDAVAAPATWSTPTLAPALAPPSRITLDYLTSVLQQHVQAEPFLGPQLLLAPVSSHMSHVERLCGEADGPLRRDVLRLGARYGEFLGWLHQDAGHPTAAMHWTGQAMLYAQELGDPALTAYLLQRRGNIATEAGYPGHGAGLALAALRHASALSPRLHAVVLRQLAKSKAALGDAHETKRALEAAFAAADHEDESVLAGYCTTAYIEMEAANCQVLLGQPEQAVATYESGLRHWPTAQERDRGLCLARLATAHAIVEDVEGAHQAAAQALVVARSTGSARILAELHQLQPRLARWRKLVEVSELNRELNLMRQPPAERPEERAL